MLVIIALLFHASPEDKTSFRVMSYNIAAGNGDIDRIAAVIREQNPDIVALQEVDVHWGARSNYIDQAAYLGEKLDMHLFFGEIYTLDPEDEDQPPRRYGLAFLSRKPFESQQNHHLTRLSSQTENPDPEPMLGFPEVSIKLDGQRIHLFNTHLDYRSDPNVRTIQVQETINIIEPVDHPTILMGDLNAQPESEELHPLFELLTDSWKHTDGPGFTFPSHQPDRRIDYILHTNHFEVKDVFVVDTEASDHRPLVVDLVLSESLK